METQKLWAQIIGVVLLLVGILGFFMNPLFGFQVNTLHNVVHLVTGAIFAWAGFSKGAPTKATNKWLGVVYILVGIVGFFNISAINSLLAINSADNWLHIVIGVVSAAIGWFAK